MMVSALKDTSDTVDSIAVYIIILKSMENKQQ